MRERRDVDEMYGEFFREAAVLAGVFGLLDKLMVRELDLKQARGKVHDLQAELTRSCRRAGTRISPPTASAGSPSCVVVVGAPLSGEGSPAAWSTMLFAA